MDDNSVDSVVCDPPYGLSKEPDITKVLSEWVSGDASFVPDGKGFMSKEWDGFVPPPLLWREVYRVLKPGGHALVFAGTRTQDLMTISLRLAGFEVRDVIEWLYFSGFPKSHDVSKAFDRQAGAEREVVSERPNRSSFDPNGEGGGGFQRGTIIDSLPATELAKKYSGWGTALKPAHEPIIVVRKPLIDADTGRKMSVVDCVERYGTGAINIDASRIALGDEKAPSGSLRKDASIYSMKSDTNNAGKNFTPKEGRFPANCITLDGDAFYSKYFNVASAQEAQPNVTPAELSKKASKKDRNSDWRGEEIDGINVHPTVKPTDLMAWFVRLVTPPNGTVLDPFAGSGSTLVAAKREGFGFIGVELTEEYIPIIEARTGVKAIINNNNKNEVEAE